MAMEQAELEQQVAEGAAAYTPLTLSFYDWWVFGVAARIFGCPPSEIFTFYELNLSEDHLDIGVGSGRLLRHCQDQQLLERVTLMDLNPNCLMRTQKALKPLPVRTVQANMLQPFPLRNEQFLSVGLNFLLHCVPGSIPEKGIVFEHIKAVLAPDGIVFGSTVMSQAGIAYLPARLLMDRYNQVGVFHNREDRMEDLQQVLSRLFENVEIIQEGCVVFFRASDGPLE